MPDINSDMAALGGAIAAPLEVAKETFDPMDPKWGALPGTPDEAPAPAKPAAQADDDEGDDDGGEEAKPARGNTSKAIQRLQRKQAESERAMNARFEEVLSAVKGLAPAAPKAAGRIEQFLTNMNGELGQALDNAAPGLREQLTGIAEEIQDLRTQPKNPETTAEINDKLAELRFETAFAKFPPEYKDAFAAEQERAMEEDGINDPAELKGHMNVWFNKVFLPSQAESDVPAPASKPSGARRGIFPVTTAPRRAPGPTATQLVQSGKGGNIAGIPFKRGR